MFWRRKTDDILEVPRKSGGLEPPRAMPRAAAPKTLDTESFRSTTALDLRSSAEKETERLEQNERQNARYMETYEPDFTAQSTEGYRRPPLNDTYRGTSGDDIFLMAQSFFLKLEAHRYSPRGSMSFGLLWGLGIFAVITLIGTLIAGDTIWRMIALFTGMALLAQVNQDNANDDYSASDPAHLSWPRRIAIFTHPSFATAKGTIRNLLLLLIFAIVMAVLV